MHCDLSTSFNEDVTIAKVPFTISVCSPLENTYKFDAIHYRYVKIKNSRQAIRFFLIDL